VFPTASHGNPTLTIVALAIRLADSLKRNEFAKVEGYVVRTRQTARRREKNRNPRHCKRTWGSEARQKLAERMSATWAR
jgi:hypothetical protein